MLECDEFYGLTPEQVAQLIASDTITVPSEEKVFESVVSWINFNTEERSQFLPRLLEHVRLPLLSQEYLLNRVESEPLPAHLARLPPKRTLCVDGSAAPLPHARSSRLLAVNASPPLARSPHTHL